MERLFEKKGFVHKVIDDKILSISAPGKSHLVVWASKNNFVIDAYDELMREKEIGHVPTQIITSSDGIALPIAYTAVGELLKIPLPKTKHLKDDYIPEPDERYWVPVAIDIVEKAIEWKNGYDRRIKPKKW